MSDIIQKIARIETSISTYIGSPTRDNLANLKSNHKKLKSLLRRISDDVKKSIVRDQGNPKYFEELLEQMDDMIRTHNGSRSSRSSSRSSRSSSRSRSSRSRSSSRSSRSGSVGGKKLGFGFMIPKIFMSSTRSRKPKRHHGKSRKHRK
uniref:Uncharacterized protein n=1 Tax=viral metagenome TaxID=1070528 RepID=A0A6C0D1L1_9ZZZZ